MGKLSYRERQRVNSTNIEVRLDGKYVGTIRPNGASLWHYTPRGTKTPGESFPSVDAVKRSLEADQ